MLIYIRKNKPTEKNAFECSSCGRIAIYKTARGDCKSCPECGSDQIYFIGYVVNRGDIYDKEPKK